MKFKLNDKFVINGTQLGYLQNADTMEDVRMIVELVVKKGKIKE